MAKKYGFRSESTAEAIIFELDSPASNAREHALEGEIVGSSEWGFISEDNGRRICAALEYFSETSTEEIERLAKERFP